MIGQWEVTKTDDDGELHDLLRDGWEPFAVTPDVWANAAKVRHEKVWLRRQSS